MKEFRSRNSGRYIFNEDIHNLQNLALSMTEMFKDSGVDFVISGCGITVTQDNGVYTVSVGSGFVFIDNKVREVAAFTGTTSAINTIGLFATTPVAPQITYVSGETDYQYNDFAAEVRLNSEETNGRLLAVLDGGVYKFPNLKTGYFAHYCILNNGTAGHLDSLVAGEIDATTMKIGGTNVNSLFVKKAGDTMDNGATLTFTNGSKSTVIGPESLNVGGSISGETLSLSDAASVGGNLTAAAIIKSGGLSTEFLKADGSVDDNEYALADEYLPLTGGTLTGALTISSGDFTVSNGNATFNKEVLISKNCTIQGDLNVAGDSHLQLIIGTDLSLSGSITKAVDATLSGNLNAKTASIGDTEITGTLSVTGTFTTQSTASIGGNTTIAGELTASKIINSTSSDSYILLGGGGTKALSDLATADALSQAAAAMDGYLPLTGGTLTGDVTCQTKVTASQFIKDGGTSSQFLKADGSVDSNTYVTSSVLNNYLSADGGTMHYGDYYLTLNGGGITLGHLEGQAKLYLTSIDRYLGIQAGRLDVNCNTIVNGSITATSLVKSGGTSSQFLKADGSVDNNTYATASSLSNYVTQSTLNSTLSGYAHSSDLNNYMSLDDGGTIYSSDHYVTIRGNGITIGHLEGSTTLSVTAQDRELGINNNVVVSGTVTATSFPTSSDERLKSKISDVLLTAEQIANAPAINFKYKYGDQSIHAGTIAQYWQGILPAVIMGKSDRLTMDYGPAAMVAVINLAKEVVALRQEISRLSN